MSGREDGNERERESNAAAAEMDRLEFDAVDRGKQALRSRISESIQLLRITSYNLGCYTRNS